MHGQCHQAAMKSAQALLRNSSRKSCPQIWNFQVTAIEIHKNFKLILTKELTILRTQSDLDIVCQVEVEGIEVNLDTSVGKWLSKLADTVTRLTETQNNNEVLVFINFYDSRWILDNCFCYRAITLIFLPQPLWLSRILGRILFWKKVLQVISIL